MNLANLFQGKSLEGIALRYIVQELIANKASILAVGIAEETKLGEVLVSAIATFIESHAGVFAGLAPTIAAELDKALGSAPISSAMLDTEFDRLVSAIQVEATKLGG